MLIHPLSSLHAGEGHSSSADYAQLLLRLDAAAAAAVAAAIAAEGAISEPLVARVLSGVLPCREALFLGNSMPIRDMDMFAAPRAASAGESSRLHEALAS